MVFLYKTYNKIDNPLYINENNLIKLYCYPLEMLFNIINLKLCRKSCLIQPLDTPPPSKLNLFSYLLAFFLFISANNSYANTNTSDFLAGIFKTEASEKKVWLLGEIKEKVTHILNHPYKKMRVGYWTASDKPNTRVWFLQEIGKERDIDVAIVIKNSTIQKLRILAFRESRGWEVKLPFFTKQFDQNTLTENNKLSNQVSNISGATLSWRAVTKLARVALYLDSQL